MKFNNSKEDLIEIVKEQIEKGNFDCRLLSGYGKDCLNKLLPGLLGLKTEFLVIKKGGTIGESRKFPTFKGFPIIFVFSDEQKAKDKAKKWNSFLSEGEKKYYKTRYLVVTRNQSN